MPVLAMTRLKLKSARLLPKFILENETAVKQLKTAKGFICGKTLAEPSLGMWTTTLWDSEENMRAYYISDAHSKLMPKLSHYACEAVTTHISFDEKKLPSWGFVHEQLSSKGRFSTVLKEPSQDHLNCFIKFPKITIFTRPLKPKTKI